MNIVILAAGPPKPKRNRHLEVFGGQPLIDSVIEKCRVDNTKLYIVIDKENAELRSHVKSISNIKILTPEDKKIYSTFKIALSPRGDCVIVLGDLIGLRKGDVKRFVNTKYKCALCRYTSGFGWDGKRREKWRQSLTTRRWISSKKLIRRGDISDCVSKISQDKKSYFLSEKNMKNALSNYKMFYPYKKPNKFVYNDIGTHMTYAFYKKIWSNPDCNSFEGKGTILLSHALNADND